MDRSEKYAQDVTAGLFHRYRDGQDLGVVVPEDALRHLLTLAYLEGSAAAFDAANDFATKILGPALPTKAKGNEVSEKEKAN